MLGIYNTAAEFCGDDFNDDATILAVKCGFEGSRVWASQLSCFVRLRKRRF